MQQPSFSNRVDLHIHSTASDGVFTPSEVVCLAQQRGLSVIALVDHDTLGGVAEAQQAALGSGLEVIPGVEISVESDQGDLHFLGYYVDPQNGLLQDRLQAMRDARLERARRVVERLGEMGMALELAEIQAHSRGDSIGRPHVAQALLHRGYVQTIQEAFDRFLGRGRPAYVPRVRLLPQEAIRAILDAGGVPVLAHPAHSGEFAVRGVPEFTGYGLRGLEVIYPHHSAAEVERLLRLCQEVDLLVTGGTDFHGPGSKEGAPLGSLHVPMDCVERLRAAAGRQ